ncbi:hypothetical protein [Streptomyces zaomyceticus]|uniref:hypothetical protein n=1 Tax=Streptomyces zaomyceticus TaxID=68286 RepID=UPI002E132E7F|nr:hypothetical protein OG237_06255 [Streptomyces zaomyceticus]
MSQTVTHPDPTQLIRSAVRDGDLPQAALFVDGDLPATVADAKAVAATAQHRIDELHARLGARPDAYTQYPLMAELHRMTVVRDRALFLAGVLSDSGSEVAA